MSVLKFIKRKDSKPHNDIPLDIILNSLTDAVLVIDHKLCIQYVNTCWEKITGVTKQHAQNLPFSEYLHPEDHVAWYEKVKKVSRYGEPAQFFLRLLKKNNDICWCEIRLQPLKPGKKFPLTATLCDVTTHIRNNDIMAANHRNLSGLLNRMPCMLYRGRNDTRWTMDYVSDGCKQLTGYTSEQLINQPKLSIGALIHPEDMTRVWETVQEALQQHTCFELTYRLMDADGNYQQVIEKGTGIYSSNGEVLSIEGFILTLNHINSNI
jgi:PAS domain S-box-containing protein